MAQLPPKAPSMTQNWAGFPFQMMPLTPTCNATTNQNSSWVDEFLDFSACRGSSHRRTVSDHIAFVESPFAEECRNSTGGAALISCNHNGFERLDDDRLRSMFSDDIAVHGGSTRSSSNPSSTNPSTSDQNSENDDKPQPHDDHQVHQPKNEAGEVDSSCKSQMEMQTENPKKPPNNVSGEIIVDSKRIKRILANRQSAQRSRVRKLHYISELERSVTTLQNEVSALSPRVAFLDHQRSLLNVGNSALKQRIAALAQDKIFKDAHQEALKKEIERLRQIHHEQNMKKIANEDTTVEATTPMASANIEQD